MAETSTQVFIANNSIYTQSGKASVAIYTNMAIYTLFFFSKPNQIVLFPKPNWQIIILKTL